jgi:hypothetical protein
MPTAKYRVTEYLDVLRQMTLKRGGRARMTVEQLAGKLDMAPSSLRAILDTYAGFQVHLVPEVVNALEDYLLIERLAEDCGGAFVRLSDEPLDTVTLPKLITAFAKLCTSTCKSIEDGRVSAEEAKRVRADGHVVVRAVLGLIAELERRSAS